MYKLPSNASEDLKKHQISKRKNNVMGILYTFIIITQQEGISLAKEVNSNHIGGQKQKNESKGYCSNQQLIH